MSLIEFAFATGDAEPLRQASAPSCVGCSDFLAAVAEAKSRGNTAKGASIKVLAAVSPAVQDGQTLVDLRYERDGGVVVSVDGSVVEEIAPQGQTDVQLHVVNRGSWVVAEFSKVSPT